MIGAGVRQRGRAREESTEDVRKWVTENPFNPQRKYTPKQLDRYATMLCHRPGEKKDDILSPTAYAMRLRREINCSDGTPDPSIVQGMYWRSHPNGRAISSPEQRRKGQPFYKEGGNYYH